MFCFSDSNYISNHLCQGIQQHQLDVGNQEIVPYLFNLETKIILHVIFTRSLILFLMICQTTECYINDDYNKNIQVYVMAIIWRKNCLHLTLNANDAIATRKMSSN